MAGAKVRTLVVPSGDTTAETLVELEAALKKDGATGTQRDLGPGGPGLYPCMGLAGVYVNEGETAEAKLNKGPYVIEEGWPGSLHRHGHSLPTAHHTVVAPHVYTQAEMALAGALVEYFNVSLTKKLGPLAGAESDMLVDGLANDGPDAVMLTTDTGILALFTQPVHLLETQALIFDAMQTGPTITDTGTIAYSKDTTDGVDGTWTAIHGHVQDISAVPHVPIDGAFPATVLPLITNIEGVKAVRVFGPHALVNLVELRFWVPKKDLPAPVVAP